MPKIIEDLENRILLAARRRLLSGDLSSFSARGIAEDCGIAVGTIYNYYRDKESLMGAVMAQDWQAELTKAGERIDAVVAHHPLGRSRNIFPEVMWMQTDIFNDCDVPINVAEALMKPRMDDVMRGVMGDNFNRTAETAEIFGIPLFNVHSAADNMVQEYLENRIA